MKTPLLTAVALLAASAVHAQSGVTLYGVADIGFQDTNAPNTRLKLDSASPLNNGSSRWGIRGSEDLGGGLKAGFNFEAQVWLDDGAARGTPTASGGKGGQYFDRAAFLSLSGDFGEVSLGRRLNPAYHAANAWELTGQANYAALNSQFGSVLNGSRNNDLLLYTAPTVGGVTLQFGHVLKGDAGSGSINDLALRYAQGPLVVAFDYNQQSGTAGHHKHLGARYDFGAFRLAAGIIDPRGPARGFTVGGSTRVGAVNLTLDIARDTDAKDTDWVLEARYPLSKRTLAYAAYLADGQKKDGAFKAKAAGKTIGGFGLGIRHNF